MTVFVRVFANFINCDEIWRNFVYFRLGGGARGDFSSSGVKVLLGRP